MRSVFQYHGRKTVEQYELEKQQQRIAALPVPPPFDPLSLPGRQQAAIMQMHESPVARTVYRRLLDLHGKPMIADYVELRKLGLAWRRPGNDWHDLTDRGPGIARDLEKALCKQFNIHLLQGGQHGEHGNVTYRCCCGWSTSVPRNHSADSWAGVYFSRHVATANGMARLTDALNPRCEVVAAPNLAPE